MNVTTTRVTVRTDNEQIPPKHVCCLEKRDEKYIYRERATIYRRKIKIV